MTKPKIPKHRYDADWDSHTSKLAVPEISEADWDDIFKHRKFREGTERAAKAEIIHAVFLARRMNSGYDNVHEYRQMLSELIEAVNLAYRLSIGVEKYNYQRLLAIGPLIDANSHYNPLVMREAPLREFARAAGVLNSSAREVISLMSAKRKPGPNNSDIYWLVGALNQTVLKHSDGGPLTRSTKDRVDVGNDELLVKKVCHIALAGSGRFIHRGTIEAAIRSLNSEPPRAATEKK